MAKTLPPVLQIMENIGGVQMPEFFGKMVDTGAAPVPPNGKPQPTPPPRAEAGNRS